MNTTTRLATIAASAGTALVLLGSPAFAEPGEGQGNSDWGQVASNTAQLDTDYAEGEGGGMGRHARSTTAADINGGFANSDNDFGITFNEENEDGNHGRLGVGNATRSEPHNEESPSDGGQGRHATNNADASEILNPVTGQFTVNAGGDDPDVSDELREGTSQEDSDSSDSSSSDSSSSDSSDSSDSSSSDSDSSDSSDSDDE